MKKYGEGLVGECEHPETGEADMATCTHLRVEVRGESARALGVTVQVSRKKQLQKACQLWL